MDQPKNDAVNLSHSRLGIHSLLELPPKSIGKGWWYSIPNLPVFALDVASKAVAIREALQCKHS
jgi:hypothetical protein